jgi:glycosyltransferase involved in cell wall biosynthesis
MDALKGGAQLLRALARLPRRLGRGVHLILAGEGPEKARWEGLARRLCHATEGMTVEFVGWVDQRQLTQLLMETDLLVVPSLWPEPFGLVGLEAAWYGVPAAAYAVGGIPDWLRDGVNGHLALGEPPTAEGLAEAIFRCLGDQAHYASLQAGAKRVVAGFAEVSAHTRAVVEILAKASEIV